MKTKIYGTIGPACCDTEMLVHLFEKGMTGIRINLSHADLEEADAWISGIHSAWSRLHDGTPEILIDLRGPELRIGTLGAERLLKEGDGLSLVADGQNNLFDPTEIPVPGTLLVALAPGRRQDCIKSRRTIPLRIVCRGGMYRCAGRRLKKREKYRGARCGDTDTDADGA